MIRFHMLVAFCGALFFASNSWPKGPTIKMEIDGDGLSAPIVITDPEILDQFNIWNGPGVHTTRPDGVLVASAHLDSQQAMGRFIDWPKGQVSERTSGLQRVIVTFFIGVPARAENARKYLVAYELDESEGFIYLPMWTNNLISHGVEGNWFYSTERWNGVIGSIVAQHTTELPQLSDRSDPECVVGVGAMEEDDTIEFRLIDKDGNKTSHWRYETTTPGYDRVRAHIGQAEPNAEIKISCWPPRS